MTFDYIHYDSTCKPVSRNTPVSKSKEDHFRTFTLVTQYSSPIRSEMVSDRFTNGSLKVNEVQEWCRL